MPLQPTDESVGYGRDVPGGTQAQAHIDRLTQSLLAKAFLGELVPTEHALATAAGRDYDPAGGLLERIAREQAAAVPSPRKTRRKKESQDD